jgi:hypothetical protein
VTNQERTTRFSFSGSPSVIERLGIPLVGGVVLAFMNSELPETALASIIPEPNQDWAINPDDDFLATALQIRAGDPVDDFVLGIVVNHSQCHVHAAFVHELMEVCELFHDDFEFDWGCPVYWNGSTPVTRTGKSLRIRP